MMFEKREWSRLARSHSFKELWIISSCLASQNNQTYLMINIKGTAVEDYVNMDKYNYYLRTYGDLGQNIVADTTIHTRAETSQLKERLNRFRSWAGDNDDDGDNSTMNDSVSASRSYRM